MNTLRPLSIGFGLGAGMVILARFISWSEFCENFVKSLVLLGATALLLWLLSLVIDYALRIMKLTKLFVQFMWQRVYADRKRKGLPDDD